MRFEVFQEFRKDEVEISEKFKMGRFVSAGWRFRLRAANNQIVAQSEAYTRKTDAVRACQSVRAAFSVTRKLVQIKVIE